VICQASRLISSLIQLPASGNSDRHDSGFQSHDIDNNLQTAH